MGSFCFGQLKLSWKANKDFYVWLFQKGIQVEKVTILEVLNHSYPLSARLYELNPAVRREVVAEGICLSIPCGILIYLP